MQHPEAYRFFNAHFPRLDPSEAQVRSYGSDPIGFVRDVLGVRLWSRQREILESIRDHGRTAVSSGHKIGKSTALACAALWYYCSFPGARVIITATTDRQVNGIIWREVRRLIRGAKLPIPGAEGIHELARSGLEDLSDFSEIKGYTAKEAEAVAGVSGAYLLYLVDEASGVPAKIYEAIEGNRAGGAGCKVALISNPTKAEGEFYEAFHGKSQLYNTFIVDSRETPNCTGAEPPIPGLATLEWVREKEQEWGEDSPIFGVRVKGTFAVAEEGKIFPLALLQEATDRWEDTDADGRLYFGLDLAGESGEGDETIFCVRRGLKVLKLHPHRKLSAESIVVRLLAYIEQYRRSEREEPPIVVYDANGPVGDKVGRALREHLESEPTDYELVAMRASDKAIRKPKVYHTMRDELHANLRDWLRDGGALPVDTKLEQELHAPEFEHGYRGLIKATDKREIKKRIGRSPDRADAVMLGAWEPLHARLAEEHRAEKARRKSLPTIHQDTMIPQLDPYDGASKWA